MLKQKSAKKQSELLHRYLLCFSNFYGMIEVNELWDIFKTYKENISKKMFFEFILIAQREENEYSIYDLGEIFNDDDCGDNIFKLLVNNELVGKYGGKFYDCDLLNENRNIRIFPKVLPKEELLKYDHDTFYETTHGLQMKNMVENYITTGIERLKFNGEEKIILDINGEMVKDKKLKDFVFLNHYEKFEIGYAKREKEKAYLLEKYSKKASEKILTKIKEIIMINDLMGIGQKVSYLVDNLYYIYGVDLTKNEIHEFLTLFMSLTNSSARWTDYGWSINELK